MNANPERSGLLRANRALDASNFFLADVRDGLGPYLAVYLLTIQKWDEAIIGLVMSVTTVAGILAQTPAGALIDSTKAKRTVMVAAAVLVTAASLLLPWLSSFFSVAASQATAHAASAVFGPALTAVTLGIFGHRAFTAALEERDFQSRRQRLRGRCCGLRGVFLGTFRRFLSAGRHVDCEHGERDCDTRASHKS